MDNFEVEFAKIEEEYNSRPTDELVERIKTENPPIVIFGYGKIGIEIAKKILRAHGNVVAFCDNFKKGNSKETNIPVISPKQLASDYKKSIVVVAVCYKYNDKIYNQVLNMGFVPENIFRRYNRECELYDLSEIKQYYSGYQWAYNFFKDDISKQIILERIQEYLFYHVMTHSPCEDQYFENQIIRLSNQEIFVDGGCYIGDTIAEFLKRVKGQYAFIYGFEPDYENFIKAQENLKKYRNIQVINKGLWNKQGTLTFEHNESESTGSRISHTGSESIETISLDAFFMGKPLYELPTFIKMDIEGAEKNALIGAKILFP